jgi:hypothetical protein
MKTTLICFSKETLESTIAALKSHRVHVGEELKKHEKEMRMDEFEKFEKLSQLRIEALRADLMIARMIEKLAEL